MLYNNILQRFKLLWKPSIESCVFHPSVLLYELNLNYLQILYQIFDKMFHLKLQPDKTIVLLFNIL